MNHEDLLRDTLRDKADEAYASLTFAEIREAAAASRRHTTRRVILLAAAAVLVVAAPTAFLLRTDRGSSGPATSPPTSVTPTGTLGPSGYGSLKLGMSYAEALRTGQVEVSNQIFGWVVKGHPKAAVCLTKAGGLMAIFADATMETPEGIHLGSTLAQLRAAYPHLNELMEPFVSLSPTTRYQFLANPASKNKVYEWDLSTTTQTCFD